MSNAERGMYKADNKEDANLDIPIPGPKSGIPMKKGLSELKPILDLVYRYGSGNTEQFSYYERNKLPIQNENTAGGVVLNDNLEVAIILRRSAFGSMQWCLPKGHLEDGETESDAAIREVFEETGIRAEILHKVGKLNYWFTSEQYQIHKTVNHFLMRAVGGYLTIENDPDKEVEDSAFAPILKLEKILTYRNEKRLIKRVINELKRDNIIQALK
jgi:8-oxo-dGTP pyrophosphatase MutT (NUDIX family)